MPIKAAFAMDLAFDLTVDAPPNNSALDFVPLLCFASAWNAVKVFVPLAGALMLNTMPC